MKFFFVCKWLRKTPGQQSDGPILNPELTILEISKLALSNYRKAVSLFVKVSCVLNSSNFTPTVKPSFNSYIFNMLISIGVYKTKCIQISNQPIYTTVYHLKKFIQGFF